MRRLVTCLVLVAAVAACTPLPTANKRPPTSPATPKRSAAPVVGASLPPIGTVPSTGPGASIVGNGGNNIIAHNGAGLVPTQLSGRVTGPASLITNGGGNLVTNGGGNLISNNGGSIVTNGGAQYRTLQVSEAPLAGAKVFLLDAAGQAIKGQDGQPAFAITDSAGKYGFTGSLPEASNYLVAVQLADGKGQLGAIAPKGATRSADVSLVSTLTTGYILSQYVRGRPEAQATLDKLPPDMEATTRTRAGTALGGGAAVPEALTTERVIETVEALRQQDASFNDQMEAVRQVLVAAGSLNLGEGQKATEVGLPLVRNLIPTADGGFYILCPPAGRIFRVSPDGVLTSAAGAVGTPPETWGGAQPAATTPLKNLTGMALDAEGRLLVLERTRLSRRMPDGTLQELWFDPEDTLAAVGRAANGALWVLSARTCYMVDASGAKTIKHAVPGDTQGFLRRLSAFGQDTSGRLYLYANSSAGAPAGEVRRYDPVAGTFENWVPPTTPGLRSMALDAEGRVYLQTPDKAVTLKKPDGTEQALRGPEAGLVAVNGSLALGPTGQLYYATYGTVFKVDGNTKTPVAGRTEVGVDASGAIAISTPGGVALMPNGDLLVTSFSSHEIVQIRGQEFSTFAGNHAAEDTGDGGPAIEAGIKGPSVVRRDAAGNVYVLQSGLSIRRIGTDGVIQTIRRVDTSRRIYDFAVTADGKTLYTAGAYFGPPRRGLVERVTIATEQVQTLLEVPTGQGTKLHVIALDADERLHVMAEGKLQRWNGSDAFETVATHEALKAEPTWQALARATFDAQGRFWFITGAEARQLNRLDLGTGTVTVVGGPGGKILNGTSVDETLENAMSPVFEPDGDLLIVDRSHNQVKRIPAKDL